MQHRRKILILSTVLMSAALQAQNLDPTVEVSREYEGKLIEVRKPVMDMHVPDTLYRFDLDFDYSVFDNPYRGSYEFNPYMLDMRPESNLQPSSKFYLKAGAGYTLHPVFDLLWSPDLKGAFSMDVYGTHRSYIGGYRPALGNAAYNGYDLMSKAGADFGYDWQKTSLDFGASYHGVAVKDFIKNRSYNALDAYCSISSKSSWTSGFVYNVALAYRYAKDASDLPLSLHDLSLDATLGPGFSSRNILFFNLGVEMNTCSDTFTSSAARFYLVPHYVLEKGRLSIDLGLRLSAAMMSGKFGRNQIVYPDIRMNLAVIPDAMRLYVNVGGGESLNSYASLIERNHHIDLRYGIGGYAGLIQPSIERVSAEAGLEGRILGFFSYNIRGGYSNSAYAPLDAVLKHDTDRYLPYIGYSPYQKYYAALDWDLNFQNVRFDGNIGYAHYWGMSLPAVFAPASFTADAEVVYNWRKRLFAGVDCIFASSRRNGEGVTIPYYADLGVYAEYAMNGKLSFWLRGGNLLNMEIQRNLLFAEKGINITGGICLNL